MSDEPRHAAVMYGLLADLGVGPATHDKNLGKPRGDRLPDAPHIPR
jgi:hypothetical protein